MKAPMTADERNAIRARAEAATEGQWTSTFGYNNGGIATAFFAIPGHNGGGKVEMILEDAEFIAHAREDIPRLLADNDALRAENAELRWQLTHAQRNNHRRNVELDALHYVWCDGGCSTGVHRYDGKGPETITPEIVAAAVRNTERLVKWSETRWARERYEARLNAPESYLS
jgi:hypothetical protein